MSTSELSVALTATGQRQLQAVIARDGLALASANIGVSRETLARMASGIPTRKGSVHVVALALGHEAARARAHEAHGPARATRQRATFCGGTVRVLASAKPGAPVAGLLPDAARAFLARTLTPEQRAAFEQRSGISLEEPAK